MPVRVLATTTPTITKVSIALGILTALVALATMLDASHFSNVPDTDDTSWPRRILHRTYAMLSLSTKVNNGHIRPQTAASRGLVALGMLAVLLGLL